MRKAPVFALLATMIFSAFPASAGFTRPIFFPVEGAASFTDTFNDGRSGGRVHEGIDIFAPKMTPLLAAVDGRIDFLTETEPSYGWMLQIEDAAGYEYWYLHVNNDTPGTDDGLGGRMHAFAQGIERGTYVVKGQLLGWLGDSGNAETTAPHLHFEMHVPEGAAIDPYESLLAAERPGRFNPQGAQIAAADINTDKTLAPMAGFQHCLSGSLIKTDASSAVYYCGADSRRYVFPNSKTYFTWYKDFSSVQTISAEEMSAILIGGNVTYKPGVRMVKIQSDPKVYAVDRAGTLRWITTDTIARALYGSAWAKNVDDLSDAFFVNYKVGSPVTVAE